MAYDFPYSRTTIYRDAYQTCLLVNDPSRLRTLVTTDLENNMVDEYTRSGLFWILHNYFDNGGNIYPIVQIFTNESRLYPIYQQAESINPKYFEQLKQAKLPSHFSIRSLYVLLALYESLHISALANIASLGTLSNQYAYAALYSKTHPEHFPSEFDHRSYQEHAWKRSSFYFNVIEGDINNILRIKTMEDTPNRDVLVGMNQAGSALRLFNAGTEFVLEREHLAEKIFRFTTRFSHSYVPELEYFTCFLSASTAALSAPDLEHEIDGTLRPIYTFSLPKEKRRSGNVIDRIIDARSSTGNSINLYGKINVSRVASHSNHFKEWLLNNGWSVQDFV